MEIANIVWMEIDVQPDIGLFRFGHKKQELLRIAAYIFMVGDRSGLRHTAIQTLLPLVHAALFDTAAEEHTRQIGRSYMPLYMMHMMAGIDASLVIVQQRPMPDQPLIMNPNLIAGQVNLPP